MESNSKKMPDTQIKSLCLDDDLTDKERLQYRLEWGGFTEIKMKSDGNCQFRALADQLFKSTDSHKQVRQDIVRQLKACPDSYKAHVYTMEFAQYVKNMSNNSVWGDEVTLKAAADFYKVRIELITSFKSISPMVILPKSGKAQDRVIYLSYLAGIHYNSIYLNGGSSPSQGLDTTTSRELQRNKNMKKSKEEKEMLKGKKKQEKKKTKTEPQNNTTTKTLHQEEASNNKTSVLSSELPSPPSISRKKLSKNPKIDMQNRFALLAMR